MATDETEGRSRVVAISLSPELLQFVENVAADDGLSLSATCRRFIAHARKNASAATAESARGHSR
jgi:hypothetical protein